MALAMLKVSQESEIDREIEELIQKQVAGKATDDDIRRYNDLTRRRAQLMKRGLPWATSARVSDF